MQRTTLAVLVLVSSPLSAHAQTAVPAPGGGLVVEPSSVACVVAGKQSRLSATIRPAASVGRARLRFRTKGGPWYSLGMSAEEETFVAVLPRPSRELAEFEYALEVTDTSSRVTRTKPVAVRVVKAAGACAGGAVAETTTLAALVRDAPEDGPPVPVGFELPRAVVVGEQKVGVFHLKQGVALGAGVAVAAGVYAGFFRAAQTEDITPTGTLELVSIDPPPGSNLRLMADVLTIQVRFTLTSNASVSGATFATELFEGGASCGIQFSTDVFVLQRGSQQFTLRGPIAPSGVPCSDAPKEVVVTLQASTSPERTIEVARLRTGFAYRLLPQ